MNVFSVPPAFLPVVISGSTSTLVAWVLTLILHRRSAALRHFVWLLALVLTLLVGPLALVGWQLDLPVLSSQRGATAAPTNTLPRQETAIADLTTPHPIPISGPRAAAASLPRISFNVPVAIWLIGAILLALRLIVSRVRLARLIHARAEPATAELKARFTAIRPPRTARLMVLPELTIPCCCGWLRPVILFPSTWREWSDARIAACLAHELAHLRRVDLLWMTLAQAACVFVWFNPLTWFAAARLRDEAENAADDAVLNTGVTPESYAASLVALAESWRGSALAPSLTLSMARPNRLGRRVTFIFESNRPRQGPGRFALATVGGAVLVLFVAALTVRLTAAPLSPEDSLTGDYSKMDVQTSENVWETLFVAIKKGDLAPVRLFLDHGLDVNADLVHDCTLLYLAVIDKQPAIVRYLISRGADVNKKSHWGDLPISRACWGGDREIARILIAAGATPDPLRYAVGIGDMAALETLDRAKPITSDDARGVLEFAVASGHSDMLDWLLARAQLNTDDRANTLRSLYDASARAGQPDTLAHLEQLDPKVKADETAALFDAVMNNSPAVVKHLLDEGVTPDPADGPKGQHHYYQPLREAVQDGSMEVVKLLLDHGANMNVLDEQQLTPLSWGAENGQEEACQLLIARGADLNIRDFQGETAAWRAAGAIHAPRALSAMLARGALVTGLDNQGSTILDQMMYYESPAPGRAGYPGMIYTANEIKDYGTRERAVVRELIQAGANPSGVTGQETPLMVAVKEQHYDAARELIADGANLKATDKDGNTALDDLFMWLRPKQPLPLDILKVLLDAGLDPNHLYNVQGMTPPVKVAFLDEVLDIAGNMGVGIDRESFRSAVRMLIERGANFGGTKNNEAQALLKAAAFGDLRAVKDAKNVPIPLDGADAKGWTPLNVALALGYDDIANWLIDQGGVSKPAVFNVWNANALDLAIANQSDDMVERLLAKGARSPVMASGLFTAVKRHDQRLFDDLLRVGADPRNGMSVYETVNGKSFYPADGNIIYVCIRDGLTSMAVTLLDKGSPSDPDLQDGRGLAYWAVSFDRPGILKALLAHGANPLRIDSHGETPVALAQKSHPDLVPILQDATKPPRSARAPAPKAD